MMDVLRLSRGMTYKAAATGLNLGGGKAVIIGDSKKDKTEALLRGFGRYVDSLGGLYITAEDVGMRIERHGGASCVETRWVTGISEAHGGSGDPSPVTAFGVLQGVRAASLQVRAALPRRPRVAIQGLGSVGRYLAEGLLRDGAKVVGCDVDAEAVREGPGSSASRSSAPDEIVDVECDIFSPCALGASINAETPSRACAARSSPAPPTTSSPTRTATAAPSPIAASSTPPTSSSTPAA